MQFYIQIKLQFFIYHAWYFSNFESAHKKLLFIKVSIFSDVVLVYDVVVAKDKYMINIFFTKL